jgi:beta-glucanase (GH16 family)
VHFRPKKRLSEIRRWSVKLGCCALVGLIPALPHYSQPQTWALVWSDEFDGPAGSSPNPDKWKFDIGGGGWGNNELESYTSRTDNAFLDGNGRLVIKAIKEKHTGPDGIARDYTSARLLTAGKFTVRFGRIEARIKLPLGQGIWPAFWMLGDNISTVGWPNCGEIDIMENIGREPSISHGSLHGPGYFGGNSITATYTLADAQRLSDDSHVFSLEWGPNVVKFFLDGNLYQTRTPADVPEGGLWVFDHPFFLLLNVAVGGSWPGSPDDTTVFPQTMVVDYVRVYADQNLAGAIPLIASALIDGKNVIVSGDQFDAGATILMNGEPRTTRFKSSTKLIGKKLRKKIAHGQSVTIQARNSGGSLSNEVVLLRR